MVPPGIMTACGRANGGNGFHDFLNSGQTDPRTVGSEKKEQIEDGSPEQMPKFPSTYVEQRLFCWFDVA